MSIYIDSHQDLFVITLHMFGFNSWNMTVIVEQRVSASEANDCVTFEILLYMSAPYTSRCYSCASLILLLLCKLDGCTLSRMVYSSTAAQHTLQWFPPFYSVSSQAVHSQSICFQRSRCAPSPILLCAGAMGSGQLFSVRIVHRFTLRALNLYKCWITCCWFMK